MSTTAPTSTPTSSSAETPADRTYGIAEGRVTSDSPAAGLDVSRLLHHAGISRGASWQRLLAEMNKLTAVQDGTRTRLWLQGRPMTKAEHVHALITVVGLPLDRVIELVDPAYLVPALWNKEMGARLRAARHAGGYTLHAAAAAAGVNVSSLPRWERATTLPRMGQLPKLLEVLELDPLDLLSLADTGGQRSTAGSWLSDHLRAVLRETGMTHLELGRRVGVSQPLATQWITGRSYPAPRHWPAVMRELTVAGVHVTLRDFAAHNPHDRVVETKLAQVPHERAALASWLLEARLRSALTRRQVAAAVGVPARVVERWETGAALPPASQWPALRDALDLTTNQVAAQLAEHVFANRAGGWPLLLGRAGALGMSMTDLGASIDATDSAVRMWSSGNRDVAERRIQPLATALRWPEDVVRAAVRNHSVAAAA